MFLRRLAPPSTPRTPFSCILGLFFHFLSNPPGLPSPCSTARPRTFFSGPGNQNRYPRMDSPPFSPPFLCLECFAVLCSFLPRFLFSEYRRTRLLHLRPFFHYGATPCLSYVPFFLTAHLGPTISPFLPEVTVQGCSFSQEPTKFCNLEQIVV